MTMRSSNQLPPHTFNLGDAKKPFNEKKKTHKLCTHTHTHTHTHISNYIQKTLTLYTYDLLTFPCMKNSSKIAVINDYLKLYIQ